MRGDKQKGSNLATEINPLHHTQYRFSIYSPATSMHFATSLLSCFKALKIYFFILILKPRLDSDHQ